MPKKKSTINKNMLQPIYKKAKINPAKSEIRVDEIHDRFVIIAPGRSKRPNDTAKHKEVPVKSKDCPFCKETAFLSQPPLHLVGPDNWWEIKAIKNIFPFLSTDNPKAYGYQEVIIETPHHNKEIAEFSEGHIVRLFETYQARTKALSQDPKIKYILIFKNHGGKAGASLVHAHSQIMASSFVPPHIVNKLGRARKYQIEKGISYYQKLADTEGDGPRRIYKDKHLTAFCPYASTYNYEAWLLPRRGVDNITLLDGDELMSIAKALKKILKKVNELELPYNFYMHQTLTDNHEYFYLRVLPRRDTWAGVELGSRVVVNTVSPEEAAKFYRSK